MKFTVKRLAPLFLAAGLGVPAHAQDREPQVCEQTLPGGQVLIHHQTDARYSIMRDVGSQKAAAEQGIRAPYTAKDGKKRWVVPMFDSTVDESGTAYARAFFGDKACKKGAVEFPSIEALQNARLDPRVVTVEPVDAGRYGLEPGGVCIPYKADGGLGKPRPVESKDACRNGIYRPPFETKPRQQEYPGLVADFNCADLSGAGARFSRNWGGFHHQALFIDTKHVPIDDMNAREITQKGDAACRGVALRIR